MISRKSIMPFVRDEKWVRALNDEIVSTIEWCKNKLKKSKTRLVPLSRKRKHITTDKIKAITWFCVVEEIQEPIAIKPPAINKLPM